MVVQAVHTVVDCASGFSTRRANDGGRRESSRHGRSSLNWNEQFPFTIFGPAASRLQPGWDRPLFTPVVGDAVGFAARFRDVLEPPTAVGADRNDLAHTPLIQVLVRQWAMPDSGTSDLNALRCRFRYSAGLIQENLARESGVRIRTISDLERGSRVSAHPTVGRCVDDLT
jgi:hypothetical protein